VAVIGLLAVRRFRAACGWGPGSVLVELSVVEQPYRAVLAVLAGGSVIEVAAQVGVSRQTLHSWLARYRDEGLGGLADRSHRPEFCSHQAPVEVEAAVCELRREHPRWGSRRLAHELGGRGWSRCPRRRLCIGSWSVTAWLTARPGAGGGRTTSAGSGMLRWRRGSSTSSGACPGRWHRGQGSDRCR
jgi:transposase-like protein